jgi:YD repeat-containing protein
MQQMQIFKLTIAALFCIIMQNTPVWGQAAATQPGTYSVSPSGAFLYQLPIQVPPGIKQLVPNLSIDYNSQGGPGLLGVGWNISGLSSITRSLPTIHHDRKMDPVDFDADDTYILDGQRLFETSQGSQNYYTEAKNFSKIQAFGTAGSGPSYFLVEMLDGVVYEYGNSSSSKMLATGKSDVLIWALNKIYDRDGNYIELEYTNDNWNGVYRIDRIKYTGNSNASVSPPAEIVFHYVPKLSTDLAYIDGSVVRNSERLDSVFVLYNGHPVNEYIFTYDPFNENHLKKIGNIRRDSLAGVELPDVNINWGKEDQGYTTHPGDTVPTSVYNTVPYLPSVGDFNGDGVTDFVRSPINSGSYDLLLNDKNDDFYLQASGTVSTCSGCISWAVENNVVAPGGKMFLDWDGDGDDDMILTHIAVSTLTCGIGIEWYESFGTHFGPANFLHFAAIPGNDPSIYKIVPGDYDGDGRRELLLLEPVNQLQVVYNCYLLSYANTLNVGYLPLPIKEARAMDFNGDGKDELVRTYDSQAGIDCEVNELVFTYHPLDGLPVPVTNAGTYGIFNTLYTANLPLYNSRLYPGDFNGDGKSDMLSWWQPVGSLPGAGIWRIHYSDGTAFSSATLPSPLTNLNNAGPSFPNDFQYFIADFNGDGKSDILQLQSMGLSVINPTEFKIFYATDFGNFKYETGILWGLNSATGTHFELGDFNGDGQADLMAHKYNGHPNKLIYFHRNRINDIVSSIEHTSHRVEIEVLPIPQDPTFTNSFLFTMIATYPDNPAHLPIKVVKSVRGKYQNILGSSSDYIYGNMAFNRMGRGFRGFELFYENDLIANVQNKTTFDLLNYTSALPILVEKRTMSNNQLISRVENHYAEHDGGANGKSRITVSTLTITDDIINNVHSTDTFKYSSNLPGSALYEFGKPDSIVRTEGDDVLNIISTKYNLSAPFYNFSKPTVMTTTSIYSNKPPFIDSIQYSYNSSGLVDSKINGAGNKTATYNFDVFGNIIEENVTAAGLANPLVNYFRYTADGRFIDSSVNPMLYQERFKHNWWGMVTIHTTADGLQVERYFDPLNRKTKEKLPTGAETYFSYNWAGGSYAPPFSRFSTTETNNIDQSFKTTFYNGYNKELRRAYTSFKDTLFEDTEYYVNGLVQRKTRPYKYSLSPTIFEMTSYDNIGRIATTQITGGANTVYNYLIHPQGLETIETNTSTGQQKRTLTSKAGKLLSIMDNLTNLIAYHYNSNGKPDSVTYNGNPKLTTSYTYDAYGRTLSSTEPNSGTTTMQYDAVNRVTSQTDANGGTYSMQYDDLGRVIQKTGPEGTYTTTYNNTSGNPDIGKIAAKLAANGTQIDYQYNSLGLLAEEKETIDTVVMTTQYSYDGFGRPYDVTYPTGHVIRHGYNTVGELFEIYLQPVNGAPYTKLWEVTAKTSWGR